MKAAFLAAVLTAQRAAAHSGVWNVFADGVNYPAFDTRMDGKLGAKRVEWAFKDPGMPWGPIQDVTIPGFTCGMSATAPALKIVARAGANVTVQWSGIVRTHYGPRMSYLGYLPTPSTAPQEVSFFKINERGYNAKAKLWSNEELINADRKDTFQLPSDIKAGTYILRTELLALHYANKGQPQFYSHCFNIDIKGDGTASPPGVRFPGAYKQKDPGIYYPLYKQGGAQNDWAKYPIPGPAKYAGKYEAPIGEPPVVTDKQRGAFPAEFQKKYDAFKKKEDEEGLAFNDKLNAAQASLQHSEVKSERNLQPIFAEHFKVQRQFNQELAQLKKEAVKLGVAQ